MGLNLKKFCSKWLTRGWNKYTWYYVDEGAYTKYLTFLQHYNKDELNMGNIHNKRIPSFAF
jgi:hypothetical protein